jgi:hypothetical protein
MLCYEVRSLIGLHALLEQAPEMRGAQGRSGDDTSS